MPVPEAQHRPRRAGQVHRRQRIVVAPVQAVGVLHAGRIGEADLRAVGLDAPSAQRVPLRGVAETVGEGQRDRHGRGLSLVRGRVGVVAVHRIDLVKIGLADRQPGIGESRRGAVGERGRERVADGHARRLAAVDLVALEGAVVRIGRPREIHALEVRHGRGQRHCGRRLLDGQLVDLQLARHLVVGVGVQREPHVRHAVVRGHGELVARPHGAARDVPAQIKPAQPAVFREVDVEPRVVVALRAARPESHLRRRRAREVERAVQDHPVAVAVLRRPAARKALGDAAALVGGVGRSGPAARDPVRQPALEALRERQRLRGAGHVLPDANVVDEPAVADPAAVAFDVEAHAQVRLAAPAREVHRLLRPILPHGRDAVDARPGRPVGRHVQDAAVARRRVVEGVPVPEAQHRPRRAGQVHRRQCIVVARVQAVRVEPERRIRQAGAAGSIGFCCDAPCAENIPVQPAAFKTLCERQGVVQRAECGFRAVRRIGAVRRDRVDAIGVGGIQREPRVDPLGLRRVCDDGHTGRLVRDTGHACHAVHRIMRKDRVGALRPRKPQRV